MNGNAIALRDLEDFYDLLAEGVDRATPEKAQLFLAKVALQLATEVKDSGKLQRAVEIALLDL